MSRPCSRRCARKRPPDALRPLGPRPEGRATSIFSNPSFPGAVPFARTASPFRTSCQHHFSIFPDRFFPSLPAPRADKASSLPRSARCARFLRSFPPRSCGGFFPFARERFALSPREASCRPRRAARMQAGSLRRRRSAFATASWSTSAHRRQPGGWPPPSSRPQASPRPRRRPL